MFRKITVEISNSVSLKEENLQLREYYASFSDRLKTAIAEKHPFHHDKALVYSSRTTQQKLTELLFEFLPHLSYSLDLAPSNSHLFQKLKTFLAERKFMCNREVIQADNDYFQGLKENHFREEIGNLVKRWAKYVELRGN